jgi:hypothetical protein
MNAQPSCYGKSWDPNHVECKGGLDPGYENPIDHTKRRDPCHWFSACGQVVESERARQRAAQPLIPAPALVRPPAALSPPRPALPAPPPAYTPPRPPLQPMPPPAPVPSYQPQYAHQPAAPQQPAYAVPIQQQMVPPYVAQQGPQYVYAPYQLPGTQMHQYLAMPEPVTDDVHWGVRLVRELFRSIAKAFGHSLAAHFDSNSIGRHKH